MTRTLGNLGEDLIGEDTSREWDPTRSKVQRFKERVDDPISEAGSSGLQTTDEAGIALDFWNASNPKERISDAPTAV